MRCDHKFYLFSHLRLLLQELYILTKAVYHFETNAGLEVWILQYPQRPFWRQNYALLTWKFWKLWLWYCQNSLKKESTVKFVKKWIKYLTQLKKKDQIIYLQSVVCLVKKLPDSIEINWVTLKVLKGKSQVC